MRTCCPTCGRAYPLPTGPIYQTEEERNVGRRRKMDERRVARARLDAKDVLPLLAGVFTASDVGHVMWKIDRHWSSHMGTIDRLQREGYIAPAPPKQYGKRSIRQWVKL